MATKEEVLDWFRGQIGYVEGPRNDNKYAKIAGHANHQPWCASFIVAGFRSVGMKLPNESAYTPTMLGAMKLAGTRINDPQVGALAFLYFPSLGRVAHMGIVEKVRNDGRFETIEGNTDVKGGRTGGRVMRKVRSTHNFTFVMPAYDKASKKTRPDCRELQRAVRVKPDNQWGEETDKHFNALRMAALHGEFPYGKAFTQKVVGTNPDGEWGAKSHLAMLATVIAVQKALSEMGWEIGRPDGKWTEKTDIAFIAARRYCHI